MRRSFMPRTGRSPRLPLPISGGLDLWKLCTQATQAVRGETTTTTEGRRRGRARGRARGRGRRRRGGTAPVADSVVLGRTIPLWETFKGHLNMVANGDAGGSYEFQPLGHPSSSPPWHDKFQEPDDGRQRFLLELEFVQLLANPTYIHHLAQNRYFDDETFVGYLKYLLYWKQPEYAKYIMYPHAFFFLDMLQSANFRAAMAHPANKEIAHRQQYYFWKQYRNNRLKQILPRPLPEAPAQPPPPPAPVPVVAAAPTKPEGSTRAGAGERRKRKYANS